MSRKAFASSWARKGEQSMPPRLKSSPAPRSFAVPRAVRGAIFGRDAASLAKGQCGPQLRQLSAVYGTLGSSCRLLPNVVQPASAYRQVEKFAQISAQCGGGRQ